MSSTLILISSLYLVFGLFEIRFPAERGQHFSGKIRNVLYATILLVSGEIIVTLLYFILPIHIRILGGHGLGFSLCIVILYVFLTDFIFYWYHRAEHYFNILWPIHELHHSDTELNVTSGMRTYWLERPLQTLFIVIPINYIIGIDRTAAIILPFVATGWLFFTHANIKLHLGFLTPVITGPQVHRIHHSILPEHHKKNFAQFFPIIDIVFYTYYKPLYNEFPNTGTPEMPGDTSIGTALVRPFSTWGTLVKKAKK